MTNFKSVDDALDFAIGKEEEANALYTRLAGQMKLPGMKELFLAFAAEELMHKQKLLNVKAGKTLLSSSRKIQDLKIADYLVDVEPGPDMDLQKALILAMKAEKAAFKLYSDLAASAPDAALKNAFLAMAQEEAKHKLRFEVLYDDNVLTEN